MGKCIAVPAEARQKFLGGLLEANVVWDVARSFRIAIGRPNCSTFQWWRIVLIGPLLLIAGNAHGQQYSVTDLGLLLGSSNITYGVNAINDYGQIAGGMNAFVYSGGSLQHIIPGTYSNGIAYDINNYGQVTGWVNTSQSPMRTYAFVYSSGTFQTLGTLPGGVNSSANAINDRGQVVGYGDDGKGNDHAFLYSSGTMQDLGVLSGGSQSFAYAINNNGQVVGQAQFANTDHAFLYSGGTMQDLGTLPGYAVGSTAVSINDSGEVVGSSWNSDSRSAFAFSNGTMQSLGELTGDNVSWANSINNLGQIVGTSGINNGESHAVLWNDNVPENLNSVISDYSGIVLEGASFINDEGQIIASGVKPVWNGASYETQSDVFLLTPTPEPSTLALLGVCAIGVASYGLRRRLRNRAVASSTVTPADDSPVILSLPCRSIEDMRRAA